jgi:hypothetical protein
MKFGLLVATIGAFFLFTAESIKLHRPPGPPGPEQPAPDSGLSPEPPAPDSGLQLGSDSDSSRENPPVLDSGSDGEQPPMPLSHKIMYHKLSLSHNLSHKT